MPSPCHHRQARPALKPACRLAALLAALALSTLAAAARAQTAFGATVLSELSVRGVSLSNGHPTVQASLDWDDPGGWYGGLQAAPGLAFAGQAGITALSAYAGYARTLANGASADLGLVRHSFRGAAPYSYHELVAGIAYDRVGARLSWSPSYYGDGGHTAYAELNAFYPLQPRTKLLAHLGWLHGLGGASALQRDHLDLRLALSYELGDCNYQLAAVKRMAVGGGRDISLPVPYVLAFSASVAF